MSEASAMHAPAPAVVPLRLAMIGFGSARMLRIKSQVRRCELKQSFRIAALQLADDVDDIAT